MPRLASGLLKTSLCALSLLGAADAAWAQQFPSKAITIVVGYTPGGQADALARAVGKRLGEDLKTPVIVENKPGANALIASQYVAKAKPDGHTLLLTTDAMTTIDPQLPGSTKFDPSAALEPIINMATAPLVLAAHKDVPADSLATLVELARKNPDSLSFGTSGNATPHRIAGEMLQQLGGFKMTHVPYKGTAASVTDLASGQIPLAIGGTGALMPMVKAGRIKMLAVTSEQRFPLIPEVPAISETFKGFNIVTYLGLMAPKGTPAGVITTLNGKINEVLAAPDVREFLGAQGMAPVGGTPADFKARIDADFESRGKIIRELNITADGS